MAETKKKAKTSTTFTKSDLKGEPTAWTAELNNGLRMPVLGYGTYKLKEDQVGGCVRKAVDVGYKLIDTAHVYGGGKTEPAVGKALSKDKGIFIITKQWRGFHGYAETKKCLDQSLKRLGRSKVDLLLMHWPGPGYSAMGRSKERIAKEGIQCYYKKGHEDIAALRLESWRAMEDAYLAGKCKAIGISNFSESHIRKLLDWDQLRVRPSVHQTELHPYLQQRGVVALCEKEGILLQAYASLGGQDTKDGHWKALKQPALLDHPAVLKAAKAHSSSPACVLLRWALQKGWAVIPKSSSKTRIAANVALDFSLSSDEMAALDALDLGGMKGRLCWRRDELRDLEFE